MLHFENLLALTASAEFQINSCLEGYIERVMETNICAFV